MDIYRYLTSIPEMEKIRNIQFDREREFDQRDVSKVQSVCGSGTVIDFLLARRRLNRSHTEKITNVSVLDKFGAYREFLDSVDKFDRKLDDAMFEINKFNRCTVLQRLIKSVPEQRTNQNSKFYVGATPPILPITAILIHFTPVVSLIHRFLPTVNVFPSNIDDRSWIASFDMMAIPSMESEFQISIILLPVHKIKKNIANVETGMSSMDSRYKITKINITTRKIRSGSLR